MKQNKGISKWIKLLFVLSIPLIMSCVFSIKFIINYNQNIPEYQRRIKIYKSNKYYKTPPTKPTDPLPSLYLFCFFLFLFLNALFFFGMWLIKRNYKYSPELTIIGIVLTGTIIGLIYYWILTKNQTLNNFTEPEKTSKTF